MFTDKIINNIYPLNHSSLLTVIDFFDAIPDNNTTQQKWLYFFQAKKADHISGFRKNFSYRFSQSTNTTRKLQ